MGHLGLLLIGRGDGDVALVARNVLQHTGHHLSPIGCLTAAIISDNATGDQKVDHHDAVQLKVSLVLDKRVLSFLSSLCGALLSSVVKQSA